MLQTHSLVSGDGRLAELFHYIAVVSEFASPEVDRQRLLWRHSAETALLVNTGYIIAEFRQCNSHIPTAHNNSRCQRPENIVRTNRSEVIQVCKIRELSLTVVF